MSKHSCDLAMFRLDGKSAAVIGAGSGIGAAVSVGCSRQGAQVFCFDINGQAAAAVAREIQDAEGTADAGILDLRDASAVETALCRVRDRHGSLDIVISTPAINFRKSLLSYESQEFDRVVDLNLKGSFHVLRTAGRIMAAQQSGSIVLFSSIRAQVVEPGQSIYAATKAGIVQMVRTLAAELGPVGVRVNAVAPGAVETPFTAPIKENLEWYQAYAAKSSLQRWARTAEIVGPTVFLASEAASFVTGSVLFVDGGWTAADGRFQPPDVATQWTD